jgi:hypothetical protein
MVIMICYMMRFRSYSMLFFIIIMVSNTSQSNDQESTSMFEIIRLMSINFNITRSLK